MNKLLKTLVGIAAPRFHAVALTGGGAPFGLGSDMVAPSARVGFTQAMARLFGKPPVSVDAVRAAQWLSMHDQQVRQADARMSDLMAQTRMF